MTKPQVAPVNQHADYPRYWRIFHGPTGLWVLGYNSEPPRSVREPGVISVVDSDDGATVKIHVSAAERAESADLDEILGIVSHDILDCLTSLTQGWRMVSASLPTTPDEEHANE